MPIKVTKGELKKYERNLRKADGRKKEEIIVTVHVSPDCKPETLQALGEMMRLLVEQVGKGKIKIRKEGER